ncbi:MAG: hypothetical protein VX130_02260 [Verrucomicrobiota bacterium]|nr:hypothetical protein [Verrucomicrobiota bacterium]
MTSSSRSKVFLITPLYLLLFQPLCASSNEKIVNLVAELEEIRRDLEKLGTTSTKMKTKQTIQAKDSPKDQNSSNLLPNPFPVIQLPLVKTDSPPLKQKNQHSDKQKLQITELRRELNEISKDLNRTFIK